MERFVDSDKLGMVRITLKLFSLIIFIFTEVLGNHHWVNLFIGGLLPRSSESLYQ